MSTNLNYKQVANVERRTWDLEAYEKKAQQRQQELEQQEQSDGRQRKGGNNSATNEAGTAVGENDDDKEEFRRALSGSAGPEGSDRAYLKRRTAQVKDIDTKVGQIEMVSVEAAATTSTESAGGATDIKQGVVKTGIGWHCKVCDCFLKDSLTYLDHINGRKHQRKLGFSMRVERSSKEDVKARLEILSSSNKTSQSTSGGDIHEDGEPDFDAMVQAKDEELQKRREEKRRRRKERKKKLQKQQQEDNPEIPTENETLNQGMKSAETVEENAKEDNTETTIEEANEEEPEIDPGLAAMMGFSGFGGSNRNWWKGNMQFGEAKGVRRWRFYAQCVCLCHELDA